MLITVTACHHCPMLTAGCAPGRDHAARSLDQYRDPPPDIPPGSCPLRQRHRRPRVRLMLVHPEGGFYDPAKEPS